MFLSQFQFSKGDDDYMATFHKLLMPVAYEVSSFCYTSDVTCPGLTNMSCMSMACDNKTTTIKNVMFLPLQFNPDLVMVASGLDAARGDPIGNCCITPTGYAHMTHLLKSLANGRVVVVLEVCDRLWFIRIYSNNDTVLYVRYIQLEVVFCVSDTGWI